MIERLRNPSFASALAVGAILAPGSTVVAQTDTLRVDANIVQFNDHQTKPRPQDWGPDRIAAPDVFLRTVPVAKIALRQSGFIGKIGIVQNQVGKRYPVASDPKYHILVEALTQRTRVPEKVNGNPTGKMIFKYVDVKPGKNISNQRSLFLKLNEFTIIEDRSLDKSSYGPFQTTLRD